MRKHPVDILLWANGEMERPDGVSWFYSHPFNVGQHVAHNEMLDECVRRNYDWHIRMDDDCWMTTPRWLKRLLWVQEKAKTEIGKYVVLSPTVDGLKDPPPTVEAFDFGREVVEQVPALGGIFRMAHMSLMRYFRFDERQPMGFGDASQFSLFCSNWLFSGRSTAMLRVRGVHCTHGESTIKQEEADDQWAYEHDMLQYMPLGL